MTRDFTAEIRHSMGPLLKKHTFSLVEQREEPDHAGSAMVVFKSPVLGLRFVRNKGDIFVEVGETGPAGRWHKLEDVLITCVPVLNKTGGFDAAGTQRLSEEYMNISRPSSDIALLKRVLTHHLGTIEERFSPYQIELTRRLLDEIERGASQAFESDSSKRRIKQGQSSIEPT